MWVLIVCSFMGGSMYDCTQGMSFDSPDSCEEYALLVSEAKGLNAYCIEEVSDGTIDVGAK